ncbi:MAG: BlaI/MecI/CopY family transcriptional regulator [Planctomycetota bacterium]
MQFGTKQLDIMRVLWRLGRASAKTITDELNHGNADVAHSTVQTQLRLLLKKHAVDFEKQDRTFVYFTLVEENDVAQDAAGDLLDRVFGGSATAMVSHLIGRSDVDAAELAEIRRLLDEHEKSRIAQQPKPKPRRKKPR